LWTPNGFNINDFKAKGSGTSLQQATKSDRIIDGPGSTIKKIQVTDMSESSLRKWDTKIQDEMDLGSTMKKKKLINQASGTSMTATKDMTWDTTGDPGKPKTRQRPNEKLSGIPGLGQLNIDQIISPSFRSYNQYNPDKNSPKKPFSIKRRATV